MQPHDMVAGADLGVAYPTSGVDVAGAGGEAEDADEVVLGAWPRHASRQSGTCARRP